MASSVAGSKRSLSSASFASQAPEGKRYKRFKDEEAERRFADVFSKRNVATFREVNVGTFKGRKMKCFEYMKSANLECLFALKEPVFKELVQEFYSALSFPKESLKGTVFLRGKGFSLHHARISKALNFQSSGSDISIYSAFEEIIFPGYNRKSFVKELTGNPDGILDPTKLDIDHRILHHAISQLLIPRIPKTNQATHIEIFYMWCCKKALPLDVPFILLSHMKSLLSKQFSELPYGMVITLIAKMLDINCSDCEVILPSYQGNYDTRLIGVLKAGKCEDDPEEEAVPTAKKGRKKTTGLVRGKKLAASPARKSGRITDKKKDKEPISVPVSSEEESTQEEEKPQEEEGLSEPEELFEEIPEQHGDFDRSPLDKPVPASGELGGTSAPLKGTHPSDNLSSMLLVEINDTLKRVLNFVISLNASVERLVNALPKNAPAPAPAPVPPSAFNPISQIAAAAAAALEEEEEENIP